MEQLLGRELAVEDVAADEVVVVLHLVRADHLAVQDRLLEVRGELVVPVDDPVRVRVELFGVRLLGPRVRHPLREQRHDVRALGAERAIEDARDAAVRERARRGPTLTGVDERLLEVRHRVAELDRTAVVILDVRARVGGEARQLGEREVDLHRAAAALPVLEVLDEVVGELTVVELAQERDLRMRGRNHGVGHELGSVHQRDTHDAAPLHQDALDR